jgi:hypothetical protein
MPSWLVSIVAGNASAWTIRWDHSDELCVGKLAGICIAIFGYGGMQRSIGGVSAIAFHVAEVRLGRPGRIIEPHRRLRIFAAQDDEGGLGPRQMLPDPLSRRG